MRKYTSEEMSLYVCSGSPLDKAGAYAIQDPVFRPAAGLAGCFANVIGLPLCHLTVLLRKLGHRPGKRCRCGLSGEDRPHLHGVHRHTGPAQPELPAPRCDRRSLMRRICTCLLALGIGLSACGQQRTPVTASQPTSPPALPSPDTPGPGATIAPSPNPTEFAPGADGVATAYLTACSQAMLDKATFAERYREAQREATVLEVATRPLALLHLGNHAEVAFQLTWKTALLGDIEREMTMPLVHEDGRWAVSWSDALILPELGGGNSLRLEHHIPARANIYDVNGLGLAVEDTAVTLGVVPGNIDDETTLLWLLNQIMALPPEDIQARYASAEPDWYVPLGDVPQDAVAPHLDALRPFIDAGGLQLRERKTRLYRDGGVAPHVTGYTNAIPAEELDRWLAQGYRIDERIGISGLEAYSGGACASQSQHLYDAGQRVPNGGRVGAG
jgi:penicillin-binding protein 2